MSSQVWSAHSGWPPVVGGAQGWVLGVADRPGWRQAKTLPSRVSATACSEPYRLMIWEARAVGSGRNIGTDTAHSQPDGCRICYDGGMMDAIEGSLIWSPDLQYRRLVVLVDAEGRGDLDSRFIKNGSDSLHLIELIEDP